MGYNFNFGETFNKSIMSALQFKENFDENKRQFDDRTAQSDNQFTKSYNENRRQYNTSLSQSNDHFEKSMSQSDTHFKATFDEGKRQSDRNYALANQERQRIQAKEDLEKKNNLIKYDAIRILKGANTITEGIATVEKKYGKGIQQLIADRGFTGISQTFNMAKPVPEENSYTSMTSGVTNFLGKYMPYSPMTFATLPMMEAMFGNMEEIKAIEKLNRYNHAKTPSDLKILNEFFDPFDTGHIVGKTK